MDHVNYMLYIPYTLCISSRVHLGMVHDEMNMLDVKPFK